MFPVLSPLARRSAALIALIAVLSMIARVWLTMDEGGSTIGAALWALARFFTILTNTLVALSLGLVALRPGAVAPPWLAALTVSILLVGIVYHVLLADLVSYEGLAIWADHGVHTIVPLATGLWWLIFVPKRSLGYGDVPIFILWPSVYLAYALWRGSRDGLYPYPFLDLGTLSGAAVATNILSLLILLLLAGVGFVSVGRFANR